MKIRKNDVVCFYWLGEFFIGYAKYETFSGNLAIVTNECIEIFGTQEFPYHKEYHVQPNDLIKIGTL